MVLLVLLCIYLKRKHEVKLTFFLLRIRYRQKISVFARNAFRISSLTLDSVLYLLRIYCETVWGLRSLKEIPNWP